MGMAASQARFLGLTARKTNIEFEGQQINQQRTMLASQSASYYNQLLTLSVPTPPSSDAFTTIQYAFTVPNTAQTATITQITSDKNNPGRYTVLFAYSETEEKLIKSTEANKYGITKNGNAYTINGKELTQYTGNSEQQKLHGNAYNDLNKIVSGVNMYYANVGTDANPSYVYFNKADLPTSDITQYSHGYKYGDVTTYKEDAYKNAEITRSGDNRVTSIGYEGIKIAVTTNTLKDSDGYDDAYNQYTYQTYLYTQQMEEINAKTEKIQAEDKKLELRLKQLDTEQKAISTEMDSVTSVIKKNTEDTFKTFA